MEAAYRQGLPHWIRVVGEDAVWHDGAVRPLLHPDPRRGAVECRIVEEAPAVLAGAGYSRLTLVLRETRRPAGTFRGRRPRRQPALACAQRRLPTLVMAPDLCREPTWPGAGEPLRCGSAQVRRPGEGLEMPCGGLRWH
ncbi:Hypothetical Protein [Streptomyces leeuwenhoekii]|uniref:Uncharacterized protein n=1 Tax=Streptomyces leeuwenhoekii TaxID=1437453 RepID=A0A0F7VU51_STRLW|nr:Hypothetical Protein [Streptomyces leeuwenhoekii]